MNFYTLQPNAKIWIRGPLDTYFPVITRRAWTFSDQEIIKRLALIMRIHINAKYKEFNVEWFDAYERDVVPCTADNEAI